MPARAIEMQQDVLPNTHRAPDLDHAVGFCKLQSGHSQAAVGIDQDLRVLHETRNIQRESCVDGRDWLFQTVAVKPHEASSARDIERVSFGLFEVAVVLAPARRALTGLNP